MTGLKFKEIACFEYTLRKIHMLGKPAMGCEAVGSQTTTAALSDSLRGAVGARANVPLQK